MLRSAAILRQERNQTMKQVNHETSPPLPSSPAPAMPLSLGTPNEMKGNNLRLFWA